MVTDRVRIVSLAAGREHLARVDRAPGSILVVPVDRRVPAWLADLVIDARAAGATVVVEAATPADLGDEAVEGWEIGICTATFSVGADVTGIDPQRTARVREITARLHAARAEPATEDAS